MLVRIRAKRTFVINKIGMINVPISSSRRYIATKTEIMMPARG